MALQDLVRAMEEAGHERHPPFALNRILNERDRERREKDSTDSGRDGGGEVSAARARSKRREQTEKGRGCLA